MPALLVHSDSTLTKRYQTTIPNIVRKALGLEKHDKIRFTLQPDGKVTLSRAEEGEEDPSLLKFLSFLADDISRNPHNVSNMDSSLLNRVHSLVSGVDVDLDSPLSDEDE